MATIKQKPVASKLLKNVGCAGYATMEKPRLTLRQKLFCKYYVETLGNGTEAVIRAGYNVSRKNGYPDRILAKSIASENLTKPDLVRYLNYLLEKEGLTDQMADVHLSFLIRQDRNLYVF